MELYIVGGLFPDPQFKGLADAAVLTISNLGFDMPIFWKNITPQEIKEFSYGPLTYGLFDKDHIPFVTMEFKSMMFDAPLNVLDPAPENLKTFFSSEANAMRLYFVSAESYKITAMRVIGLDMEFVNHLKVMMLDQLANFHDSEVVNKRIQQIWQRVSTHQMIKSAKRFKLPGAGL